MSISMVSAIHRFQLNPLDVDSTGNSTESQALWVIVLTLSNKESNNAGQLASESFV